MVAGTQRSRSTRRGVFILKREKEGRSGGWLKRCLSHLFFSWSHWTPFPSALFFPTTQCAKAPTLLFSSHLFWPHLPINKRTHTLTQRKAKTLHHPLTFLSVSYIHMHDLSPLPSSSHPNLFPEHLFFCFLSLSSFFFCRLGLTKCTAGSFLFQLPLRHIFYSWALRLNFSSPYTRSHSTAKTWQTFQGHFHMEAIHSAYNAYLSCSPLLGYLYRLGAQGSSEYYCFNIAVCHHLSKNINRVNSGAR